MSEEFVKAVRSYLNVPFLHHGRTRYGTDCVGLVVMGAADCGRILNDVRSYKIEVTNGNLECTMRKELGPPLPWGEWYFGCVALFRTSGLPHHIGVLADYPQGGYSLIHASSEHKKVVEQRLDPSFSRRIVRVFPSPV